MNPICFGTVCRKESIAQYIVTISAAGHWIVFGKGLQANRSCPGLSLCTFSEAAQHPPVPGRAW